MKVTKNTTIQNLFINSDCFKYKQNLYYGWDYINDQRKIGELNKDVWPNDDVVESLNILETLNQSGNATIINFDKNKDINFIALSHHDKRKCALIYSGGAYCCVCNVIEALPIAIYLYKKGYDAFIGTYSINEKSKNGNATNDVLNGINYLLKHQDDLNIDMTDYLIGGFSAGSHAVGELLTDNKGLITQNLPFPKLMFLAYPVITMDIEGNLNSRNQILGTNPSQKEKDFFSIEKHLVDADTKIYFWQCERDNCISFEHSKRLEEALKKTKIKYIYRHYDSDAHGWGIATNKPAAGWVDEMLNFYNI